MKITALLLAALLLLSLSLVGCKAQKPDTVPGDIPGNVPGGAIVEKPSNTVDATQMDFSFTNREQSGAYTEAGATVVTFAPGGIDVKGGGALVSGNVVTLSIAGTYLLSGESASARIVVDVPETEKLQLVLCGLRLTASDGPAIFVRRGDKIFITLQTGSENVLSDSATYTVAEADTTPDGTIFSKSDLVINGAGTLTVQGNHKHGIVSKDDLVLCGGTVRVTAAGTALAGKDAVKIKDSTLTLTAGSDGIQSDNAEDATRGYVYIAGGTLDITAGKDGIQAETVLKITAGTLSLQTGGGSANTSTAPGWGFGGSATTSGDSAKGLKSAGDVLISGGSITVNSADDSIHANGAVEISGGTFTLSSGDDGVHADTVLTVTDGSISILKSYEGLESTTLQIGGGRISLVASDDGLNAAGGNDGSAMGRPGAGGFTGSTGTILISGGYLLVNAAGDGIDANGSVSVTGGVTLVAGPTNNGNGAFDYDGSASVTGGVLIALGSTGMAQGFTTAENQGAILTNVTAQSAGTALALLDADGNVVAAFTPTKAYSSAVITAPGIQKGQTYTLVAGATLSAADENGYASGGTATGGTTLATLTMSSLLYGSSGGMGGMMPGDGSIPGGGGPGTDRPSRPGRW